MNESFFCGASLCFGLTKTLLCEAKHPDGLNNVKNEIHMKTIKNRNINGRPAKKPSEKKAYKITVKMATEEYYSLKAKARLAGINRSEFIRQCIRSVEVKQRLTPELVRYIRQLSGMANNVNQIARTANAAGYLEVHSNCIVMSERLDKIIQRITDDC